MTLSGSRPSATSAIIQPGDRPANGLKLTRAIAPIGEVLVVDETVRPERHEPVRLLDRQRAQQDAAHDAENRGIGAGAERQQQDCGCREPGPPDRLRTPSVRSGRRIWGLDEGWPLYVGWRP